MESNYAAQYKELYDHHWWWRSRERIIYATIKKTVDKTGLEILDVGCGSGLFFTKLHTIGKVHGIEVDVQLAQSSAYSSQISTKPIEDSMYDSYQGKFDLIVALDVLEHIQEDSKALNRIFSFLKPDGTLILTVPAMMSLWDKHDEINHHFRRYSKKSLLECSQSITKPASIRYFYHWTVLPKLLVGLLNKFMKNKVDQAGQSHYLVNQVLYIFSVVEFYLTRYFHLPFGSSLMAVYKKGNDHG